MGQVTAKWMWPDFGTSPTISSTGSRSPDTIPSRDALERRQTGEAVSNEYRVEVTEGGTVMLQVGDYLLCLLPAAASRLATELGQAAAQGAKIRSDRGKS